MAKEVGQPSLNEFREMGPPNVNGFREVGQPQSEWVQRDGSASLMFSEMGQLEQVCFYN